MNIGSQFPEGTPQFLHREMEERKQSSIGKAFKTIRSLGKKKPDDLKNYVSKVAESIHLLFEEKETAKAQLTQNNVLALKLVSNKLKKVSGIEEQLLDELDTLCQLVEQKVLADKSLKQLEKLEKTLQQHKKAGRDHSQIWLKKTAEGDFVFEEKPSGLVAGAARWLRGDTVGQHLQEIGQAFRNVAGFEGQNIEKLSLLHMNVNAFAQLQHAPGLKIEADTTQASYRFLLERLLELAAKVYPDDFNSLKNKEQLYQLLSEGKTTEFFAALGSESELGKFLQLFNKEAYDSGFTSKKMQDYGVPILEAIVQKQASNEFALALFGWMKKDPKLLDRALKINPSSTFALGWKSALILSNKTATAEGLRQARKELLAVENRESNPLIEIYVEGISEKLAAKAKSSLEALYQSYLARGPDLSKMDLGLDRNGNIVFGIPDIGLGRRIMMKLITPPDWTEENLRECALAFQEISGHEGNAMPALSLLRIQLNEFARQKDKVTFISQPETSRVDATQATYRFLLTKVLELAAKAFPEEWKALANKKELLEALSNNKMEEFFSGLGNETKIGQFIHNFANDPARCQEVFERCLKEDPNNEYALTLLGWVRKDVELLDRALTINPQNSYALAWKAISFITNPECPPRALRQAKSDLLQARKEVSSPLIDTYLGICSFLLDETDARHFNNALRADPEHEVARTWAERVKKYNEFLANVEALESQVEDLNLQSEALAEGQFSTNPQALFSFVSHLSHFQELVTPALDSQTDPRIKERITKEYLRAILAAHDAVERYCDEFETFLDDVVMECLSEPKSKVSYKVLQAVRGTLNTVIEAREQFSLQPPKTAPIVVPPSFLGENRAVRKLAAVSIDIDDVIQLDTQKFIQGEIERAKSLASSLEHLAKPTTAAAPPAKSLSELFHDRTLSSALQRRDELRKAHIELEKKPDPRWRVFLNVLFLGGELLSGLRWYYHDLPLQVEELRERAEKMSVEAGYEKVATQLPPEQQAELQHELLMIEGLVTGLYTLTDEQFQIVKEKAPQFATFIQNITTVAPSDEWLQSKLSEYRHSYVAREAPKLSVTDMLWQGATRWTELFFTPLKLDLITNKPIETVARNVSQAIGYAKAIDIDAHTVRQALIWEGEKESNPFLQKLHPGVQEWLRPMLGKKQTPESISSICSFFERVAVNSATRLAYQRERFMRNTEQCPVEMNRLYQTTLGLPMPESDELACRVDDLYCSTQHPLVMKWQATQNPSIVQHYSKRFSERAEKNLQAIQGKEGHFADEARVLAARFQMLKEAPPAATQAFVEEVAALDTATTHLKTQIDQVEAVKRLVEEGFPADISSKDFAHLAADFFATNSGLEGSSLDASWRLMLHFLEKVLPQVEKIDPAHALQLKPIVQKWTEELKIGQKFYQNPKVQEAIAFIEGVEKTGFPQDIYKKYVEAFSQYGKDGNADELSRSIRSINTELLGRCLGSDFFKESLRKKLEGAIDVAGSRMEKFFELASFSKDNNWQWLRISYDYSRPGLFEPTLYRQYRNAFVQLQWAEGIKSEYGPTALRKELEELNVAVRVDLAAKKVPKRDLDEAKSALEGALKATIALIDQEPGQGASYYLERYLSTAASASAVVGEVLEPQFVDRIFPFTDQWLKPTYGEVRERQDKGKIILREAAAEASKIMAEAIKEDFQALPAGKTLMLQGGWKGRKENPDHALSYGLEKHDDNTLAFTIVNTGAGTEYHPDTHYILEVEGKKTKVEIPRVLQIDFHSIDDFLESGVLPLILLMKYAQGPSLDVQTEWGGRDLFLLYTKLQASGARIRVPKEGEGSEQYSGICAFAALIAFFESTIRDPKTRLHLNTLMKAAALDRFLKTQTPTKEEIVLARDVLEFVRQMTTHTDASGKAILSAAETLYFRDQLTLWEAKLKALEATSQLSQKIAQKGLQEQAFVEREKVSVVSPQQVQLVMPSVPLRSFHYKDVDAALQAGDTAHAISMASSFCQKMDISQTQAMYSQMTSDEKTIFVTEISHLAQSLAISHQQYVNAHPQAEQSVSHDIVVTALYYLTLLDALDAIDGERYSIIPQSIIDSISHNPLRPSPELVPKLHEIQTYIASTKRERDFFLIDGYEIESQGITYKGDSNSLKNSHLSEEVAERLRKNPQLLAELQTSYEEVRKNNQDLPEWDRLSAHEKGLLASHNRIGELFLHDQDKYLSPKRVAQRKALLAYFAPRYFAVYQSNSDPQLVVTKRQFALSFHYGNWNSFLIDEHLGVKIMGVNLDAAFTPIQSRQLAWDLNLLNRKSGPDIATWDFKRPFSGSDYSKQLVQELKYLQSNKETQVVHAIEFFRRNTDLLATKDMRTYFASLIFQDALLIDLHHPVHATFGQLIDRGFHDLLSQKDFQSALELLEMAQRFNEVAKRDVVDVCRALREVQPITSEQRAVKAYIEVRTFVQKGITSDEDAKNCVQAIAEFAATHEEKDRPTAHVKLSFLQAVQQLGPQLESHLSTRPSRWLNALAKQYGATRQDLEWSQDDKSPTYFTAGDMAFSIATGEFMLLGGMLGALPADVTNHLHFKQFMQGRSFEEIQRVVRLGPNHYRIELKEKSYTVHLADRKQLTIQTEERGLLQQFIPPDVMKMVPESVKRANTIWTRGADYIVKDVHGKARYKIIPHIDSDNTFTSFNVYLLDTHERETHRLLPADDKKQPYAFLAAVENPEMLRIWENLHTHEIDTVEMPSFGENMLFRAKGHGDKRVFESVAQPGTIISENQYVDELRDFTHKLVVQKATGEREVWIPSWDFERKQMSISVESALDHTPASHFHRYTIDPLHNDQLVPQDRAARAHLAYIHLWHHNYPKALSLLQQDRTYQTELSDVEKKEYRAISAASAKTSDKSPPAVEVALRAQFSLVYDSWIATSVVLDEKNEALIRLKGLYEAYLGTRYASTFNPLSVGEELRILHLLPEAMHTPLLAMRLQELQKALLTPPPPAACIPVPAGVIDPASKPLFSETELAALVPKAGVKEWFMSFFTTKESSAVETAKELFSPERAQDSLSRQKVQQVSESLDALKAASTPQDYEVKPESLAQLKRMHEKVVHDLEVAKERQGRLRGEIEALINVEEGPLAQRLQKAEQELEAPMPTWQAKSFEICIDLVLASDFESFQRVNPLLSEAQVHELYGKCVNFLANESGEIYRREALITATSRLIGAIEKRANKEEVSLRAKDFIDRAKATRAYDIGQDPQLLVYEVRFHQEQDARLVFATKQQVESLKTMNHKLMDRESLGIAHEAVMGSGKSSLVHPKSMKEAVGLGKLAILVVPQNLKAMYLDIGRSIKLYGVQTESFPSRLRVTHDVQSLRTFLLMLEHNPKEGIGLFATPQELLAKKNEIRMLINQLSAMEHRSEEDSERLELAYAIQARLREAVYVVDEMAVVFDPHTQYLLPEGAAMPLAAEVVDLIYKASQILLTQAKDLGIPIEGVTKAEKTFSEEDYKAIYKPKIVDALVTQLHDVAPKGLKEYLLTLDVDEQVRYEAQIDDVHLHLALNSLKMHLDVVLPNSLGLAPNIKFGLPKPQEVAHLSPDVRDRIKPFIAIPGGGANSLKYGSEFGNFVKTMWATIVSTSIQGIQPALVEKRLKIMQEAASKELKAKKLEETESFKEFQKLMPPAKVYSLFSITQDMIQEITDYVNSDQGKDGYSLLMRQELKDEVTVYPSCLSADPVSVASGSKILGAAGANPFPESYPQGIETTTDPQSIGVMVKVLEMNPEVHVVSFAKMKEKETTKEKLDYLYASLPKNAGTLIDLDGAFAGINEEDMPRALLTLLNERGQNREGVVAFLTNKSPVIVTPTETVPYSHAKVEGKNVAGLYVQTKTVGSDARLPEKELAIVLKGKSTIATDEAQADMRLRQLGLDKQRVLFVVDEEALPIMQAQNRRLGVAVDKKPTASDVLRHTVLNEADAGAKNTLQVLPQHLNNMLKELCEEIESDSELSLDTKSQVSRLFKSLYVQEQAPFYRLPQTQGRETWARELRETFLKTRDGIANGIMGSTVFAKYEARFSAIDDASQKLVDSMKEKLPEKIVTSHSGVNSEVNIQTTQTPTININLNLEREQEPGAEGDKTARKLVDWTSKAIDTPIFYSKDEESFVSLNAAFTQLPEGLFSDNLILTCNVISKPTPGVEPEVRLFERGQLDTPYMLVVMERDVPVQFVLLSHEDYNMLHKKEKLAFPIVDLDGRLVRGDKEIVESAAFTKIRVQAKLFNGELEYSDAEKKMLQALIQETGFAADNRPKLQHFFELQLSHARRDATRVQYPSSELFALFSEKGLS